MDLPLSFSQSFSDLTDILVFQAPCKVFNSIFSVFAWIIFNPNPLDFTTVLFTFIFGTYVLRIFISLVDTPFVYLARLLVSNNSND